MSVDRQAGRVDARERSRLVTRSRYEAFIFDLDGVVVDTARLHSAAWKEMFDDFLAKREGDGFEPFGIETDYREYVDGKPRYDGVRDFLLSRDISLPYGGPEDPGDVETICGLGNRKNVLFLRLLEQEGPRVFPGSLEILHTLRQRGFKTAVASSSRNCYEVLDSAGISDLFDVRVDGIDIASLDLAGKPAPDMFLEAARRLDVPVEKTVVLEDAISGVRAGAAGGFGLVIGVDRGDMSEALREGGADIVVRDLAELDVQVAIDEIPDALRSFDRIRENISSRSVAAFFDYDGTLTPIVSRPEEALLPGKTRKLLVELAAHAPVSVISGRGLADVEKLVGIPGIYYAGSHGFEIQGPDGAIKEQDAARDSLPALDDAERELRGRTEGVAGAQVERKKYSIATHYRNVADDEVDRVKRAVEDVARGHRGLRLSGGKKVIELRPDIEWDKGLAVEWLLEALGHSRPTIVPLYIGDDVTDEDAFRVLRTRGITIVVGEGARETRAQYRLKDTGEVVEFLRRLTDLVEEESSWWLGFGDFIPGQEGLREALCTLGNGYFATRGAAAESTADDVHYPATYLAGGYNRLVSEVAGRPVENEDLVNMPNWLCLSFRARGGEWLDTGAEVLDYSQELDIRGGLLHRAVHLRDAQGRETRISSRRLVSAADIHVAATETLVTPLNWSGVLEVRSAIDGAVVNDGVARYREFRKRHLEPAGTREIDAHTILLETRTNQSRIGVAVAARTEVYAGDKPLSGLSPEGRLAARPDYIAQTTAVEVSSGDSVSVEKTVALYTSRDFAISECALEAEHNVLEAPRFGGLLEAHREAWKHHWNRFRLDLTLSEPDEQYHVQMILRLYSFHLLQSTPVHTRDIDVGVPARGWHGEAYRGHIFWDELIIFPFLSYRVPEVTRALLMYRYRRLREARKAARALGYKGAMFPWQSGSNGREESQKVHLNPMSGNWIPDNSELQRHLNSAIAYNVWQYYQVTGDIQFLSSFGAEMILEIARFWASIAEFNTGTGRYEIRGVMGPDEYHDAYPGSPSPGLNNNSYTNVMAVFVMNRALELSNVLPEREYLDLREKLSIADSEVERWREISRRMAVTFFDNGIISQFTGYEDLEEFDWDAYREKYGNIQRLDRILEAEGDSPNRYKVSKQADVLMLFYLFSAEELREMLEQLGYEFDPASIPRNIDYYLKRTSNGSSLSWIIHSWVAARADRERSWELFKMALLTDFGDIQGGTTSEGIHLGAMSACVDLVQRGYTGLEPRGGVLRLNPAFPDKIADVEMHVRYRGHWLRLRKRGERMEVEQVSSGPEPIEVRLDDRVLEFD